MKHSAVFFLDSMIRSVWFNQGIAPIGAALRFYNQGSKGKVYHCDNT